MPRVQKVLFVCLGNICRSPIAEGVFMHLVKERNLQGVWQADSAAIGSWHKGKKPDRRAMATMEKHGIDYDNRARQIQESDFTEFDFILGMDDENMIDLEERKHGNAKAKLQLLGEYDPEGERIIRDPYYDNDSKGFEKCYEQCIRCCTAFLEKNSV